MNSKIRNLNEFLALLEDVTKARNGQYMALCSGHILARLKKRELASELGIY